MWSKIPPPLLRTVCPTSTADPLGGSGGGAVAPPAGDAGVSGRQQDPVLGAVDGDDWGVYPDPGDSQGVGAGDRLGLTVGRVEGDLVCSTGGVGVGVAAGVASADAAPRVLSASAAGSSGWSGPRVAAMAMVARTAARASPAVNRAGPRVTRR